MNTYYFNDPDFMKSDLYKDFIKENPSTGFLRIRAYSANEALPVEGIKIMIKTNYKDNTLIFYEGKTNDSGLIDRIKLPAPKSILDNMTIPNNQVYDVEATYEKENLSNSYKINMYEDICVVQNINVTPKTLEAGVFVWQ